MRRTEAEINRIIIEARVRALNVQPDTPWWYLSFADDDGFHGACIVQGYDMAAAIAEEELAYIGLGSDMAPLRTDLQAQTADASEQSTSDPKEKKGT